MWSIIYQPVSTVDHWEILRGLSVNRHHNSFEEAEAAVVETAKNYPRVAFRIVHHLEKEYKWEKKYAAIYD